MRNPVERQHVVPAQGMERDVARQHHLVVPLLVRERREIEVRGSEHLGVGGGDPSGSVAGVVVVGVLTEHDEQRHDRPLGRGQVDRGITAHDSQACRRTTTRTVRGTE